MEYETVIGLEVHCQLATRSKIFCSAPAAFGALPNTNIDALTFGLPGSLPVLSPRKSTGAPIRSSIVRNRLVGLL